MGNFFLDLGKGFVRSAVNQVGRDSGRVISNSIYGDAHSIPIRNVCINRENVYFDESTNEAITPEELQRRAILEGFTTSGCKFKTSTKIAWYIILLIMSLLIYPLAAPILVYLFIKGIMKISQRYIYIQTTTSIAQFLPDKRYKDGKRLSGYKEEQVRFKATASHENKKQLMKTGILYITLSIATLTIGGYVFKLYLNESDNKKTEKKSVYEKQKEERDSILKTTY